MVQQLDIVLRQNLDFNIKLVELVEQHPSIYRLDPASRVLIQDAWKNIAEIIDYEVSYKHLRQHWKALRYKYVKFVKKGTQDSPDRIESYMHFLKPYLRVELMAKRIENYRRNNQVADSYSPTMPKIAHVESCAHLGLDPGDQDVAFLLSIWPHMKVMTGHQRRQFKIGAVMLSGEILSSI